MEEGEAPERDFYDGQRYGVIRQAAGFYSVVDKQKHEYVFDTMDRGKAHRKAKKLNKQEKLNAHLQKSPA